MKLGRLLEGEDSPVSNEEVIQEARKCLVNIIGKAEELTVEFVRLEGHFVCLKLLKEILAELQLANGITSQTTGAYVEKEGLVLKAFNEKYEPLLVPLCRLLFTSTRPLPPNKPAISSLREKNLLDVTAEFIFIYSFVFRNDPSLSLKLYLQDLLRILVNLTLEHGALGSSDIPTLAIYIPRFPRLICSAYRFFEVVPARQPAANTPKDPVFVIHQLTASALANVPAKVAGALFLNEDGGLPPAEEFVSRGFDVSKRLFEVLDYSITAQETEREYVPTFARSISQADELHCYGMHFVLITCLLNYLPQ